MKIFKFNISWEKSIEKLYEFIISNCPDYFGVSVKNTSFYICPMPDAEFLIYVYNDSLEGSPQIKNPDTDKWEYTSEQYKTVRFDVPAGNTVVISDGFPDLPENEIRYLKWDKQTLLRQMAKVHYCSCNWILKIPKHEATMQYDRTTDRILYSGTYQKSYKDDKKRKEIDITQAIENTYL